MALSEVDQLVGDRRHPVDRAEGVGPVGGVVAADQGGEAAAEAGVEGPSVEVVGLEQLGLGAVEQAVGSRGGGALATSQVVVESLLAAVGREEGGLAAGGGGPDPQQVGQLARRPLGRLLKLGQLVDE